jgi:hypothetical protein
MEPRDSHRRHWRPADADPSMLDQPGASCDDRYRSTDLVVSSTQQLWLAKGNPVGSKEKIEICKKVAAVVAEEDSVQRIGLIVVYLQRVRGIGEIPCCDRKAYCAAARRRHLLAGAVPLSIVDVSPGSRRGLDFKDR